MPLWMRFATGVTRAACAIALLAAYHTWSAPYSNKVDLRYDRVILIVLVAFALSIAGEWSWRRYRGKLVLVAGSGALAAVIGLLVSLVPAAAVLVMGRPLLASGGYDTAATEFSNEIARLTAPNPALANAKQAAVSALERGGPAELIHALALIRDAIPVLENDRDDVATLEQRGREMFERHHVWSLRTDAYFGWKQPLRDLVHSWCDTCDAAVARYRMLEAQLEDRLAGPAKLPEMEM